MDDPQRTPHLFHPDLRDKDRAYTYPRMFWMTKWWYGEEKIGWFGDAVRPGGGNGMYCTQAQHAAWPHKVAQGNIMAGPK